MAELHEVDVWLAALLSQLEPAARKKMLREVARDVRRIQQANITAQRSPTALHGSRAASAPAAKRAASVAACSRS